MGLALILAAATALPADLGGSLLDLLRPLVFAAASQLGLIILKSMDGQSVLSLGLPSLYSLELKGTEGVLVGP